MEKISKTYDVNNIVEFKQLLCNQIDEKTEEQIFQGFTFDGHVFSLSISAQINWSNLFNIPDQLFPLTVSCKDDTMYSLSLANRQTFYLTALNAKNTALQLGNTKKAEVNACTTLEQLKTISDSL